MINPIKAVKEFTVKTIKTVNADSPTILTAVGIVAFGATVVLVAKETPKAVKDLEEAGKYNKDGKVSPKDKASVIAKNYWPAALAGVGAVSCFVGANHISILRVQAAMAAYKMSENKFSEYQDKVVEKFGAKKEKEVREDISQDTINQHPAPADTSLIPHCKGGDTLCYDNFSGRYFYSDMQTLRSVVNDLNREFDSIGRYSSGSGIVALNDFYQAIGLETIDGAENWLWSGDATGLIEPDFDSFLTRNGTPVLVVEFENGPIYDTSGYRDLII